ncbi:MAG TPA: chemotaxis protein CheW [Longimicrobiales bacterium]|nr:chemotaxis protein CheW [Longimicrobiales bacterium]
MGAPTPAAAAVRAGRYLVFVLGSEEYGIEVLKVREIIGPLPITRVPRMPEAVRGVINLRGKVIPVVDLRVRFGLEAVDHGARTCMIVVQTAATEFAAMVDRVCEVAIIAEDDIEDTPAFGAAVDTDYLLGVAKVGSRVRLLLDIERALSQHELVSLAALPHAPTA